MASIKKWFKELSRTAKVLVVVGVIFVPMVVLGAAAPQQNTPKSVTSTPNTPAPKTDTKTEMETVAIPCSHQTVNDPTLEVGTTKTTQQCVDGVKTQTFRVTYVDGVQASKVLMSEETTTQPVDEIIANGTKPKYVPPPVQAPAPDCDPNYTPCLTYHGGADYDCAGGTGNGPYYVYGEVKVIGTDVYGLDRDHDGIGCD